ncbi:putative DNA binding domain-containing protein, partial [Candidatus Peregrinibacteria bacterium]|nr:putative DNA binding domain-containing protein [Candidatus Peregrinibacteria bacterium]
KRLFGDKVVKKTIQTIVALANTDGGSIIFGVDDPEKTQFKGFDRIFGIEENKELFDEIFQEIKRIIPPISNLKPDLIEVAKGKTIAILHVPKATEAFYSIDDRVWIRLHKSNKKLTPQEIVKLSYAKGFEKADKELVDVDFDLLKTSYFEDWRKKRGIEGSTIEDILFQVGLARKNDIGKLQPTRAAVLLFSKFPTNLMETKCAIRVFKYKGTLEKFEKTPNLIGKPKTIDGPISVLIKGAHEYILGILESGIEIHSGFVTKYKIPERAVKEVITNAVIHRDYHLKRDIEVKIFEDRMEVLSPGLFPYNITKRNIGYVRADGYRNDLLVKHLREFPDPPNLDRNEGVRAMRSEMNKQNLFPPIFFTYPNLEDSIEVILINEERPNEWEIVYTYLKKNKYINNSKAREITSIVQIDKMSKLFKKWVRQGLLEMIISKGNAPKYTKYTLPNSNELNA